MEMTRVEPAGSPTRTADGKTLKASTKVRQNVVARPGASSGRVMRVNRDHHPAPSVAAARSRVGSMPDRYDRISRKANGKPVMTSEKSTPQKLLVSRTGPSASPALI